jgi:hypothetical protein
MCLLLMAGFAQAVDIDFVDTGDGLWSTLANWQVAGLPAAALPTASDWAKISNKSSLNQTATIGAGVSAFAGKTHIGYKNTQTLNIIDGGSLYMVYQSGTTNDADLLLGKPGATGILNISGALSTLTCRDLEVGGTGTALGNGTLNMTGGLITVADDFEIGIAAGTTTGIVNLDGGTIKLVGSFETPANALLRMYTGGSMNFGGDGSGKLILPGDKTSVILGYITNTWITCTPGLGTVTTDLTTNPGYTTVYVIPEPATMVLLGLGGLLLRKRR